MTPSITVRRCRAKDLDRILHIERASFGHDAYDRNLFAEFLDSCRGLFLVVEREHLICGYLVACIHRKLRRGIRSAELVSVAVDPIFRRTGAASLMMDSILRRLRARSVDLFTLMVRVSNEEALAFYAKYGFRRVRIVRRYYADGADALLLSLWLHRKL